MECGRSLSAGKMTGPGGLGATFTYDGYTVLVPDPWPLRFIRDTAQCSKRLLSLIQECLDATPGAEGGRTITLLNKQGLTPSGKELLLRILCHIKKLQVTEPEAYVRVGSTFTQALAHLRCVSTRAASTKLKTHRAQMREPQRPPKVLIYLSVALCRVAMYCEVLRCAYALCLQIVGKSPWLKMDPITQVRYLWYYVARQVKIIVTGPLSPTEGTAVAEQPQQEQPHQGEPQGAAGTAGVSSAVGHGTGWQQAPSDHAGPSDMRVARPMVREDGSQRSSAPEANAQAQTLGADPDARPAPQRQAQGARRGTRPDEVRAQPPAAQAAAAAPQPQHDRTAAALSARGREPSSYSPARASPPRSRGGRHGQSPSRMPRVMQPAWAPHASRPPHPSFDDPFHGPRGGWPSRGGSRPGDCWPRSLTPPLRGRLGHPGPMRHAWPPEPQGWHDDLVGDYPPQREPMFRLRGGRGRGMGGGRGRGRSPAGAARQGQYQPRLRPQQQEQQQRPHSPSPAFQDESQPPSQLLTSQPEAQQPQARAQQPHLCDTNTKVQILTLNEWVPQEAEEQPEQPLPLPHHHHHPDSPLHGCHQPAPDHLVFEADSQPQPQQPQPQPQLPRVFFPSEPPPMPPLLFPFEPGQLPPPGLFPPLLPPHLQPPALGPLAQPSLDRQPDSHSPRFGPPPPHLPPLLPPRCAGEQPQFGQPNPIPLLPLTYDLTYQDSERPPQLPPLPPLLPASRAGGQASSDAFDDEHPPLPSSPPPPPPPPLASPTREQEPEPSVTQSPPPLQSAGAALPEQHPAECVSTQAGTAPASIEEDANTPLPSAGECQAHAQAPTAPGTANSQQPELAAAAAGAAALATAKQEGATDSERAQVRGEQGCEVLDSGVEAARALAIARPHVVGGLQVTLPPRASSDKQRPMVDAKVAAVEQLQPKAQQQQASDRAQLSPAAAVAAAAPQPPAAVAAAGGSSGSEAEAATDAQSGSDRAANSDSSPASDSDRPLKYRVKSRANRKQRPNNGKSVAGAESVAQTAAAAAAAQPQPQPSAAALAAASGSHSQPSPAAANVPPGGLAKAIIALWSARSPPPPSAEPPAVEAAPLPPPGSYYEHAGQRVLVPEWPEYPVRSLQQISSTLSLLIKQAVTDKPASGALFTSKGGEELTDWGKGVLLKVKAKVQALAMYGPTLHAEVRSYPCTCSCTSFCTSIRP